MMAGSTSLRDSDVFCDKIMFWFCARYLQRLGILFR